MTAALLSFIIPAFGQLNTAEAVLRRSAKLYASMKSYADSGSIQIVSVGIQRITLFKTDFDRRTGLRFEADPFARGAYLPPIVLSPRGSSYTLKDGASEPRSMGISAALKSLVGRTGGAAMDIPALLLKLETGGSMMLRMQKPAIIDRPVLTGTRCVEIMSPDWIGGRDTVWIEVKSGLIRQYQWEVTFPKVTMPEMPFRRNGKPREPVKETFEQPSTTVTITINPIRAK